jgi:hypothetical protein
VGLLVNGNRASRRGAWWAFQGWDLVGGVRWSAGALGEAVVPLLFLTVAFGTLFAVD